MVNGEYCISNLKTHATEEQIEAKGSKIADFENREYLAQHIILLTTLIHLGARIKDLNSAEEMWKVVKADATYTSWMQKINCPA